MVNNIEKYLKSITIDASIKSIAQLYSRYEEVAKTFNLNYGNGKNGLGELLLYSIKIELPTYGSKSDKNYIVLNHIPDSNYDNEIKNILKEIKCDEIFEKTLIEKPKLQNEEQKDPQHVCFLSSSILKDNNGQNKKGTLQEWLTMLRKEKAYNEIFPTLKRFYESQNVITEASSKLLKDAVAVCEEILKFELRYRNDPIWKSIHYVFYSFDQDSNQRQKYLSSFVGASYVEEEIKNDNKINQAVKNDIYEISALVKNKHISNLMELVRRESVKSAKAAIMSRNMSHNLGSHVMFYIKQKLESVEKIFQSGALRNLMESPSIEDFSKRLRDNNIKLDDSHKELPFLVGLGRFLNYLQERQDYIATVATNYIPYCTSINFKDAIYDELKPEKHAQRHNGDATGRKAANLLLDYIAKSEGFESSDKIEIFFGDDFCGGDEYNRNVPDKLRTFNVSLPGGTLGRQAFFSIMENIIRNTAKHDGSKAKDRKLVFQFDILSADEIKNIECYSKRKNENFDISACYHNFQDDYVYLGITVKLYDEAELTPFQKEDISKTISNIKEGLEKKYLKEDSGEMDEECKGLKEIRLSAAWIRGKELDDEIPNNEPPAVSVRKNGNNLQYIICLPKPKKIAIVTSVYDDNEIYHKQSCRVFSPDDISEIEISKYELIVYHGKRTDDKYRQIRQIVGSRIYVDESLEIEKDKPLNVPAIYQKWLELAFPNEKIDKINISIIDEKSPENISTDDSIKDKLLLSRASSESRDKYYKNSVIFNTHYPGQALMNNKELFAQARFVEAISGGNSTDRLIRHDERNFEWFSKQLATGLCQVAIFDERLFRMIMPTDEKLDRSEVETVVKAFIKDKTDNGIILDFKTGLKDFINYEDFKGLNLTKLTLKKIFNESVEKQNEKGFISCDLILDNPAFKIRDYSKTWKYREMGVWGFDIQMVDNEIKIKGYNSAPTRAGIGLYNPYYKEDTIGIIKRDSVTKEIIVELNIQDFKNKFDFISIHQGLLDKIYDTLEIKKSKNEKEKVTKAIFDIFSVNNNSAIEILDEMKEKCYYLPQFIIHSGRSKPNKDDMPQHQPFLQFSAIDHALRDCKYTLTELLYSAHYEGE